MVLELCENPEKLIGYWLFASSGWSVWSLQRNLFKETSFLFWKRVWLLYLYKSNLARKCKIRSGWNWPTFTHTLPVAVSHCRIIAESPGLFALVFGPRSAAEFGDTAHILLYLLYPGDHLLVQVVQMRAVSIACIRIELLVDDLPFGDGWPASISCPHPHQVLWCDEIRRSTRQLWHEDIIHWKQLSFQSAALGLL